METNGFNGKEIRHFTGELSGNAHYGYPWKQVVDAYLKSGYREEDRRYEIAVLGSTYKVLKHENVTAFYDADGNALFDVANGRLEKEYECLMDGSAKADAEITNQEEGKKDVDAEKYPDMVGEEDEKEKSPEAGAEEIAAAKGESGRSVKQKAKEKMEKALKEAEDKAFEDPVICYLLERCADDEGLAQDIVQESKTWQKCLDYIYSQARKQSKGNCAAVREDVIYEWAEDYYHKDDKAEEERKAKKEAEEMKVRTMGNAEKTSALQKKEEAPKELPKPKKATRE